MKDKTPQKHKRDEIQKALALLESGQTLSDVAKEFSISKSLLSYWRDHASEIPNDQTDNKKPERTRKFITRCWNSIALAFKKLDSELKKEKPLGVRDLALAIAVLRDKLAQAEQNMRSQAVPASTEFTVSEDTWMILQRHREAKVSTPPAENIAKPGLGAAGLEQQKREVLPGPGAEKTAQDLGDNSKIRGEEVN
jgi:transposase-like protein